MKTLWPKFKEDFRCPACNHADWSCRYSEKVYICMRIQSSRPSKDGGWYHKFSDDKKPSYIPARKSAPKVDPLTIKRVEKDLSLLAKELKVTEMSLKSLEVVWSNEYKAWLFPMRNGANEIIGWNRRYENGDKKIVAGTKAGLYIPQVEPIYDPLFICEGGSDTAALFDMGLQAIGRFNCNSGAEYIKAYCKINSIHRIVIIADHDSEKQKDGDKVLIPGRDGALKLKKEIGLMSVIVFPPSPLKDMRQALETLGERLARTMLLESVANRIWTK